MHPQVKEPAPASPQNISTHQPCVAAQENQPRPQPSFVLWYGRRNSNGKAIRKAWRSLAPAESILHFVSAKRVFPFLMDPTTTLPRVVVLEANACGFKLLQMIRSAPALAMLPVAMVAQSGRFSALSSAYTLGADWCFVAPQDTEQARFFAEAIFTHFRKGPARMAVPGWARNRDTDVPDKHTDHWYDKWAHELHARWGTLLAWGKSLTHS